MTLIRLVAMQYIYNSQTKLGDLLCWPHFFLIISNEVLFVLLAFRSQKFYLAEFSVAIRRIVMKHLPS